MNKREIIKIFSSSLFVVLGALLVSYSFTQFIHLEEFRWFVWIIISSIIFLSLFILQSFFIKGFFVSAFVSAFEALALGAFFVGNFSPLRLIFLVVFWLALLMAKISAARELSNSLQIRFFKVAGTVLGAATKGLAIFFTVFYLSFIAFQDPGVMKSQFISIGKFTPGISFDQTVGELLESFSSDVGEGFLPFNLGVSFPNLEEQLEGEGRANLEEALTDLTGVKVRLTDSVNEIVYSVAADKLAGLSPQMKTVLWIISGITFYLTIRLFLFIIGWLSVLLSFVIYYILLTFHFFRIESERVDKEVIAL